MNTFYFGAQAAAPTCKTWKVPLNEWVKHVALRYRASSGNVQDLLSVVFITNN